MNNIEIAMIRAKNIYIVSINGSVVERISNYGQHQDEMLLNPRHGLDMGIGAFIYKVNKDNEPRMKDEETKIREIEISSFKKGITEVKMNELLKRKPASDKSKIGEIL